MSIKPREEIVELLFGSCLESQLNQKKISFHCEHLCDIFTQLRAEVMDSNLNLALIVQVLVFVIEGRDNPLE